MADVSRDDAPASREPHRSHHWTAKAIRAQGSSSLGGGLVIVAGLLGLSWLISYVLGGAGRVPPHWFYVPVLLAAARFGLAGAAITAVVAGIIAGPLLPLDVPTGEQQHLLDWTARLGFFLGIGLVMGAIIVRLKASLERDRVREEAERAKQEAERANQAKSEFLSRMSHELRTPLNSVLGFGELLEMDDLSPEQRESVHHILKGGRHLLDLINEVLDIARIESGKLALSLEPVSIRDVVGETFDLVRPLAAEAGVTLLVEPIDGHAFVRSDRQRLKQVLLNLLSNAVKFNRKGGSVTVRCEDGLEDRLRISVADDGPGIEPELIGRLFVPFERLGADAAGIQGTGLGLALSKGLVEAMGGSVSVQSTKGEGSTFVIELSRTEPEVFGEGFGQEGAAEALPSEGLRTLLYVEDNPANFKLIERALTHRPNLRLVWAIQGSIGVELGRQHQPDLILLDLHLPDIPGEEVLRLLRADPRTAQIPVVVLSADATPGQIKKLLAAGAADYLTKPLQVRRFLETVDKVLIERSLGHAG